MTEATGELALHIEKSPHDGRSIARRQFHRGALRVIKPHYLDDSGQVNYTVVNPGGAYFGGDFYDFTLDVADGASLLLTTQSATKVYRTPQGCARQRMHITVGDDAIFESVPDQLIVYREGSYRQNTIVDLHPRSSLVLAEIVTPGWSPEGLPFRYDDIRLRTQLRLANQEGEMVPYVVDNLRVQPASSDLGLGMLEGYSHCGQLLLADHRLEDRSSEVVQEMEHLIAESGVYASLTFAGAAVLQEEGAATPRCVAVRSLSDDTSSIMRLHTHLINAFRKATNDRSPLHLRKY